MGGWIDWWSGRWMLGRLKSELKSELRELRYRLRSELRRLRYELRSESRRALRDKSRGVSKRLRNGLEDVSVTTLRRTLRRRLKSGTKPGMERKQKTEWMNGSKMS